MLNPYFLEDDMNNLYYVTGYDARNNEWWRFSVTADTETGACGQVREHHENLTSIYATFVCTTTDDVFKEL